ncbi:MAG: SMC family ATPase [Dehalococcoidia bacterium]|jgi:exonuclease SbcC
MLLKKLKLNNFLSHEATEIDFDGELRLLIDGASGSGKTSVADSIAFALYGVGRTDTRGLVMKGKDGMSVTLTLDDGDDRWTIFRSCSSKGTQSIAITLDSPMRTLPPLEGTKERQAFIEREITGCSYGLFVNSVVSPQETPDSFVKATAARRKELLLEMAGGEVIDGWLEKAKLKGSEMSILLSERKSEVAVLERMDKTPQLEALESIFTADINQLKSRVSSVTAELADAKRASEEAASSLSGAKSADAVIQSKKDRLNALNDRLQALRSVRSVDDIDNDIKAFKERQKESERLVERDRRASELYETVRLLAPAVRGTKGLEDEIVRLSVKSAGIAVENAEECPVIGKECPIAAKARDSRKAEVDEAVARARADLDALKSENARVSAEIARMKGEADSIALSAEEKNLMVQGVTAKAMLSALEEEKSAAERLNAERESISSELDILGRETSGYVSAVPALEAAYRDQKSREDDLSLSLRNADRELSEAEAVTREIEKVRKEVEASKEALKVARASAESLSSTLDDVTLVKDALGTNGVKAMVVDRLIPRLEARANEILSSLSGMRVSLSTQKPSADGKKSVEGLFITVTNAEGREIDYDGYSGGERMKVSVAITEALASMQKCRFRIFDETFIGLDDESVERFSEILVGLGKRFPQVMCISHVAAVKTLFDDVLTVEKAGGKSRVNRN